MRYLPVAICLFLLFSSVAEAGRIPDGQSAGSSIREYQDERQQLNIKNRLIHPVIIPPSLNADEISILPHQKSAIRIVNIIVQYGRDISIDKNEKGIQNLINRYVKKKLSLERMNLVAKQISEIYGDNKVKVYIPEQSFAGGVLLLILLKRKMDREDVMGNEELKAKIFEVIKTYPVGSVATIKDGKPWVRYMATKPKDDLTLYTSSFAASRKIGQLKKNDNIHIAFGADPKNWMLPYVNIEGKAEIFTDLETKKMCWDDMLAQFFEGPEDPNFVVIKVTPSLIEYMAPGAHVPEIYAV